MCFKTEIHITRTEIENRFGRQFQVGDSFEPRYYFSAFDFPKMPVITRQAPDTIQMQTWGLIPSWITERDTAFEFRKNTLNARFETLSQKKSFSHLIGNNRCLLIAHGFFEYQHVGKARIPYYIRRKDNKPFAIAGLYDEWLDLKKGEKYTGFSLITSDATPMMSEIHNSKKRMPLILPEELENIWLSKADYNLLPHIIKPVSDECLEAWPVNDIPLKNSSYLNSPQILEKRKPESAQLSLF